MSLLLASASPRRRALLEMAGYTVTVCPVNVDETILAHELPDGYLERVVDLKLGAGNALARQQGADACLVADTVVLCDEEILGKPTNRDHARAMIGKLAGRRHIVASRFALAVGGTLASAQTIRTEVWFRRLSPEQVARYVSTGEGDDKAGAYAIQGIGGSLVERIVGSYTSVVGLPLAEVVQELEGVGMVATLPVHGA